MSKISKALDKLRAKCTAEGSVLHGNSTAAILDCIAEHYQGGGGGGAFVATFTADAEEEGIATCDKTFSEIKAAIDSGIAPVAHCFLKDERGIDIEIFANISRCNLSEVYSSIRFDAIYFDKNAQQKDVAYNYYVFAEIDGEYEGFGWNMAKVVHG